jgi:hypothetical protein
MARGYRFPKVDPWLRAKLVAEFGPLQSEPIPIGAYSRIDVFDPADGVRWGRGVAWGLAGVAVAICLIGSSASRSLSPLTIGQQLVGTVRDCRSALVAGRADGCVSTLFVSHVPVEGLMPAVPRIVSSVGGVPTPPTSPSQPPTEADQLVGAAVPDAAPAEPVAPSVPPTAPPPAPPPVVAAVATPSEDPDRGLAPPVPVPTPSPSPTPTKSPSPKASPTPSPTPTKSPEPTDPPRG